MNKNDERKYNKLVERITALRMAADQARADMMLALYDAEQTCMDIIQGFGHGSFDAFIKTHDFCQPAAYRDFVAGLAVVGDAGVAREIGVHATSIAPLVPSATRGNFVTAMLQSVNDAHKQPSRGAARGAAVSFGMPTTSRALTRARELEQLRAENQVLRAENRKLRAQLDKIEKARAKAA